MDRLWRVLPPHRWTTGEASRAWLLETKVMPSAGRLLHPIGSVGVDSGADVINMSWLRRTSRVWPQC